MFFHAALGVGGHLFLCIVIVVTAALVAAAYVDYQRSCKRCRSGEDAKDDTAV